MLVSTTYSARLVVALQAISELANLNTQFYVTGSRFFGAAHTRSDWDFMMAYDPSIAEHLLELGYTVKGGQYSGDHSLELVLHKEHVDIQLVKPDRLRAKLLAQDVLLTLGITDAPDYKWNALVEYFHTEGLDQ